MHPEIYSRFFTWTPMEITTGFPSEHFPRIFWQITPAILQKYFQDFLKRMRHRYVFCKKKILQYYLYILRMIYMDFFRSSFTEYFRETFQKSTRNSFKSTQRDSLILRIYQVFFQRFVQKFYLEKFKLIFFHERL